MNNAAEQDTETTFSVGQHADGAGWVPGTDTFGSFFNGLVVEASDSRWTVQSGSLRYTVTRSGLTRRPGPFQERLRLSASEPTTTPEQETPMSTTTETHHIETGWNPTGDGSMRAFCNNCQTWFSAFCSDSTDWVAIRSSEQAAKAPFADFSCFDGRPSAS